MANFLGTDLGISMPSWNIFSGVSGWTLTIIAVMLLTIILGAVAFWLVYSWRVFKYKIEIYENTGHGYRKVGVDRARLIKVGDGGEEILFLKRMKVYRGAYGKKMGKNIIWFFIGQDGYWYNCVLGDADAKMGMLDIEPIDRDMRLFHVAIRKNIADRYKTKKIITTAAIVMGGLVITVIIMFIGNWFILDKIGDVMTTSTSNIEATERVAEMTKQIVSSLGNVCSGSGIKVAG